MGAGLLRFFSLPLLIAVGTMSAARPESVPNELARLQKQTGLSLILVDDVVQVMIPTGPIRGKQIKLPEGATSGEISVDGTEIAFVISRGPGSHLAISHIDGTALREYPYIETTSQVMYWSHDRSLVTLQARVFRDEPDLASTLSAHEQHPRASLQIVDLHSGQTQKITEGLVTSQCWSPDDKQLIYEAGGNIGLYDLATHHSQVLASGQQPTWSPDGQMISFVRDDGYYSVSPSGIDQHRLFKKFRPRSGLLWSPDSRFVVYVSQSRHFECGFALDLETYCLRIRRMSDNSEWRVSPSNEGCACQWVLNKKLLSVVLTSPRK